MKRWNLLAVRGLSRGRELAKRTAVAAVGLPCLAWIIKHDARASAVLFAGAAAVGTWEYYRLVFGVRPAAAWIGVTAAVTMPLVPAFVSPEQAGVVLFTVLAAASMLTWAALLFGGPRATAPEAAGQIIAGALFSSVGLVALSALRTGSEGVAWTMLVMVAAWANDASAYLIGRSVGRTAMWPAVSPGKTWEGYFGGLCDGVLALLLLRSFAPRSVGAGSCVAIGIAGGVLGPVGDLCKSMLKRAYHVKDDAQLRHRGVAQRRTLCRAVRPSDEGPSQGRKLADIEL